MNKKTLILATMSASLMTLLISNNAVAAEEASQNEVNKPTQTSEILPASGSEQAHKPLPIKAPMLAKEDATEVKVIIEKNRTIEEYRHRGELIMVKVIPNKGKPYFIDPLENRQQGSGKELMNAGVKPVHWVVKEF